MADTPGSRAHLHRTLQRGDNRESLQTDPSLKMSDQITVGRLPQ